MTASEYKSIRKENLRDNMTGIEVILTGLCEAATRELVKEKKLNKSIIRKNNNLDYKYDNKINLIFK